MEEHMIIIKKIFNIFF